MTSLPLRLWRGQRLAVDDTQDLIDSGVETAIDLTLAKQRRDGLVDDAVRGGIGEHALEPVTHLDAQRPIVPGNDQQGAIIDLTPPELPLSHDPDRVLLDRL